MISFRFHLVSLTAVFLALALGIVLGVAALDQATVSGLENRIKVVRNNTAEADRALKVWTRFGNDAEATLETGRLDGVRVLLIAPADLDGSVTDKLHSVFATAGAIDAGTLRLDNKWADESPRSRSDIAGALGIVGPISSSAVVDEAAARIARDFVAGGGPTLPALASVNLVHLDAGDPATTPGLEARIVVVDNGPPTGLLEPLARALGTALPARVLVADAGPDDAVDESLVGLIRADPADLHGTTVDHIRTIPGRIAAVLAIRDFDRDLVGDYGSDPSADRAAPASGG